MLLGIPWDFLLVYLDDTMTHTMPSPSVKVGDVVRCLQDVLSRRVENESRKVLLDHSANASPLTQKGQQPRATGPCP